MTSTVVPVTPKKFQRRFSKVPEGSRNNLFIYRFFVKNLYGLLLSFDLNTCSKVTETCKRAVEIVNGWRSLILLGYLFVRNIIRLIPLMMTSGDNGINEKLKVKVLQRSLRIKNILETPNYLSGSTRQYTRLPVYYYYSHFQWSIEELHTLFLTAPKVSFAWCLCYFTNLCNRSSCPPPLGERGVLSTTWFVISSILSGV